MSRWRLITVLVGALALAPMTASATTLYGNLGPGAFADWYQIYVPSLGWVDISLPGTADSQGFLFDGGLNGILGSDGDNANGQPDHISTLLGGGNYWLAVTLWDVDPYNSGGGLVFPSHGDGYQYAPDGDPHFSYWSPLPPNDPQDYTLVVTGGDPTFDHTDIVATPEPASLTLFGTGIIGLCGRAWRRRRTAA